MSEFWTLADGEFGRLHSRTLVRDHVIRVLGDRTAEAALAAGAEPRDVWIALCDDLQVPEERRRGAEPPARRRR